MPPDDLLDFLIFDEIAKDEWRNEYRFNEFDLDPDDYDDEFEFLDALNNAETQRLEDEEYDEEY